MFVIKEMRLNKFEPKPIVSNRELFSACGAKPGTIESKETADCFDAPTLQCASKTKVLGLASDIALEAWKHYTEESSTDGAELNTPAVKK